jgi:hypothetical protein
VESSNKEIEELRTTLILQAIATLSHLPYYSACTRTVLQFGAQLCFCGKDFKACFLFELAQFAPPGTGKAFCLPDNNAVHTPSLPISIFK